MGNDTNFHQLLEDVDELLTDSTHPLDEKQARKLSLMMLRQIMNVQFDIQREIADWKTDVKNRRDVVNERLAKIESEVGAIKQVMAEYPSLTWLLRYRTTPTIRWGGVAIVIVYILLQVYPQVAAWVGLPPLP